MNKDYGYSDEPKEAIRQVRSTFTNLLRGCENRAWNLVVESDRVNGASIPGHGRSAIDRYSPLIRAEIAAARVWHAHVKSCDAGMLLLAPADYDPGVAILHVRLATKGFVRLMNGPQLDAYSADYKPSFMTL